VEIVDMRRELQRGNRSLFSQSLRSSLETLRDKGEQAILFVVAADIVPLYLAEVAVMC